MKKKAQKKKNSAYLPTTTTTKITTSLCINLKIPIISFCIEKLQCTHTHIYSEHPHGQTQTILPTQNTFILGTHTQTQSYTHTHTHLNKYNHTVLYTIDVCILAFFRCCVVLCCVVLAVGAKVCLCLQILDLIFLFLSIVLFSVSSVVLVSPNRINNNCNNKRFWHNIIKATECNKTP